MPAPAARQRWQSTTQDQNDQKFELRCFRPAGLFYAENMSRFIAHPSSLSGLRLILRPVYRRPLFIGEHQGLLSVHFTGQEKRRRSGSSPP